MPQFADNLFVWPRVEHPVLGGAGILEIYQYLANELPAVGVN